MSSDIVTRFRAAADRCTHGNERFYNGPEGTETYFKDSCELCVSWKKAADEIEQLRNTLTVIADAVKSIDGELPGGSAYAIGRIRVELMEALYG